MKLPTPRGFSRFRVGHAHAVTHDAYVDWARDVLGQETLYEWAAAHAERRALSGGRLAAYAVPVPGQSRGVVVRHSQHGGLLGPLRGDLYFPPTRAPYELLVSYVLAGAGVRTPPVVAFAVYQAGLVFRRSDVVTLELPGRDLGSALLDSPEAAQRASWLERLAALVRSLTGAGAWHPDLNVRNILLVPDASGTEEAYVLDVDRIRFAPPGDPHVRDANLDRLERSVRKWRALHGAGFDDAELRALRAGAAEPAGA